MTLTLLPAVDVADGRAVRMIQGRTGTETADSDPLDSALAWQADGAAWVHLVDLDAAFGRGSNASLLAEVVGKLDVDVQLSGGICDDASLARALATGCARVNLSTSAVEDRSWCARIIATHGERIAVSLDVRITDQLGSAPEYQLVARGSTRGSGDLWETLGWLDDAGCARYVVTDVGRDGMLSGPNLELYRAVTDSTSSPVITSGGISAIEELVGLAEVARSGANLEGAIIGKALYAGRFTLPAALEAMRQIDAQ